MNDLKIQYGYIVKYIDLSGQAFEEMVKGYAEESHAYYALQKIVNDLKDSNEIVDARVHAYQSLPEMITVIGSSRYSQIIKEIQDEYTYKGFIVLDGTTDLSRLSLLPSEVVTEYIGRLKRLGLFKVRIADLVYVVNKDGYIGESTREKILYAETLQKSITYLEPVIKNV